MLTTKRFGLGAQISIAGLRDTGPGVLASTAVMRAPVLPTRHASQQLELPLAMPPAAARQRLRTG